MTEKQISLYRWEWNEARKVLRGQGVPAKECEERRTAIHIAVCGSRVSSVALKNGQFDKVLGKFREISQPTNLAAQTHAAEGALIRTRHVVLTLCAQLEYDDDSLQSMIDRMQREGRLREPALPRGEDAMEAWSIELAREPVPSLTFLDLREEDLDRAIIPALKLQLARIEKREPEFAF